MSQRQIPLIADYFYSNVWALTEEKLAQIEFIVAARMQGIEFSDDEIREYIGIGKPKSQDGDEQRTVGGVRVLSVFGVIEKRMNLFTRISGGTSTDLLVRDIQRAADDPKVKAIVLDVDSPGGSVFGPGELATAIRQARKQKRVVAVANELMASAAYWIGSAANEVVVTETAAAGSIGVLSVHTEYSAAEAVRGIKTTVFKSTRLKAAGNSHEPLSEDAAASIQARIDHYHNLFVEAVAENRQVPVSTVRSKFATGEVFIGGAAVDLGLADRIGTLQGVVTELADGSAGRTSVRVEGTMTEQAKSAAGEKTTAETNVDLDKIKAEASAEAKAAEITRQKEIRSVVKTFFGHDPVQFEKVSDHCIDKGLTVDEARVHVLKELEKDKNSEPLGTIESRDSQHDKFYQTALDGISLRIGGTEEFATNFARDQEGQLRKPLHCERVWDKSQGRYAGFKWTGKARQIHKDAYSFSHMSLLTLASEFIRVSTGQDPVRLGWSPMKIASMALNPRAAGGGEYHTTGSFPALLLDAANKTLLQAYMEASATWRRWVHIGESVPDFKNINRVRLGTAGDLEHIPEGSAFPQDELADTREYYAVQTRGKAYSMTREMIINDDLGAFNTATIRMARAAERTVNRAVYALLNSNPSMRDGNTLFDDTNHGNHVASGGAAPTVGELNKMQQRLRKMVDPTRPDAENNYLNLNASWIAVPPEIEGTTLELLASEANPAAGGSAAGNSRVANIWQGRLEPIIEPELSVGSTTAWYVGGDWRDADHCEVSFLRGEETPRIEDDMDFDTKGRKFSVHQTFGVKFIDWVNIIKNKGAA